MSSSPSLSPAVSTLDLDTLETDPALTFVLKVGEQVMGFEVLFYNEAFRKSGLRDTLLGSDRDATLFRAWTQSLGYFKYTKEFAGKLWTAKVTGVNENWKIVRAAETEPGKQDDVQRLMVRRTHMHKRSRDDLLQRLDKKATGMPMTELDKAHLYARWESMQVMMEMSDVGVFEYEPSGKLIHANDAWYRLSNYPRDLPSHAEFSFMDLAYPDDQPNIMAAWNTLTQGKPVTFEMRWKARPGSGLAAQWILTSCVPVFDEKRNLVSIAGNTIDINAQKVTAEAAQARIEALEQARISEEKFARFAELSPIAIYIYKPGKGLQFVNDKYYSLTGARSMDEEENNLSHTVFDEDADRLMAGWTTMLETKKLCQMEYRLKKTWVDQEGVAGPTWVQGSFAPECDENGTVISVMGTVVDISHFKWAERVQKEKIDAALEAKRQQENFIDMTSHELRNPLSAIVQCADSVLNILQCLLSSHLANPDAGLPATEVRAMNEKLESCIESIQTVVSCSLHQKRIIDDVLTLSKLDSNLLLITPERVNPFKVVSEAMKMFEPECNHFQIQLRLRSDESWRGFEWVMMDPSRMLQVLVNLLTNAIKFTKEREKKEITITLGASWTRPDAEWKGVQFASTVNKGGIKENVCDGERWGTGKKMYLWLKVQDTGCGMTGEEQSRLFARFLQATPRTHVKYGGSAIGLFVSKALAALQGGSIGISSKADYGSTFVFYISTRIAPSAHDLSDSPDAGRPSVRRIASQSAATASFEAAMKRARLHILIVEDNIVNQRVLSKQLQNVGCIVNVAGNGLEALEWLKSSVYWRGDRQEEVGASDISNNNGLLGKEKAGWKADIPHPKSRAGGERAKAMRNREVDIVLMDIEMPVMDGLTCARHIRQYEEKGLLGYPLRGRSPSVPLARSYARQLPHSLSSAALSTLKDSHVENDVEGRDEGKRILKLPILAISANTRGEQIEEALKAGMDDSISKPFRIPELWPKMVSLIPRCSWIRD